MEIPEWLLRAATAVPGSPYDSNSGGTFGILAGPRGSYSPDRKPPGTPSFGNTNERHGAPVKFPMDISSYFGVVPVDSARIHGAPLASGPSQAAAEDTNIAAALAMIETLKSREKALKDILVSALARLHFAEALLGQLGFVVPDIQITEEQRRAQEEAIDAEIERLVHLDRMQNEVLESGMAAGGMNETGWTSDLAESRSRAGPTTDGLEFEVFRANGPALWTTSTPNHRGAANFDYAAWFQGLVQNAKRDRANGKD